jgi:hypothetical protein
VLQIVDAGSFIRLDTLRFLGRTLLAFDPRRLGAGALANRHSVCIIW